MSQLIFSLNDVYYEIAGKPLFEELSMQIHQRDRICLVGKNGAGKTTLMRMITGELEPDAGQRFVHPDCVIGYLAQSVPFQPQETVKEFVLRGIAPRTAEETIESLEYLADMVIAPLELNPHQKMELLSGGQVRRAALARALVMEPDILLLDEPTNHMDMHVIQWLEEYLASYRGALICISHDRAFLTAISQRVYWLDSNKIRVCPHGYGHFDEWMERYIEQESRALRNLEQQVQAGIDWTQGGVTGRRKRNVRRVRELEQLREKLRQDKNAYNKRSQKLDLDPVASINNSRLIAEFRHVYKSFTREGGTIPILHDFSHKVMKGDKIGIIGRNGSGKSSVIKLITGELEADKGSIFRSKQIDISYFDQQRAALNPAKTLQETLCPEGGQHVHLSGKNGEPFPIHVCGYLKKFLFDPSQVQDKVSTLSGGQQNRLLLAKVLANPGNLLILDEPTNDLDMDTLDMLQDILSEYKGTLILVSHDRDFLDRCVTELYAFEGNAQVQITYGGYSDYIREKEAMQQKARAPIEKAVQPTIVEKIVQAPVIRSLTYSERLELANLPDKLSLLEQDMAQIHEQLEDTQLFQRAPEQFHHLLNRYEALKSELAQQEERWLLLEERALL
ncbi:MAG: ABC transporter ATP-binding protein [Alphaproteobacteria bacterium]|nr:MAG: ABC transporter ATP-binding protein [Alphaproteobacteria bacterium]